MRIYLGPAPDLKGDKDMQLGPIKEMFEEPPKEVQEKLEAEPPTIFKILDSLDLPKKEDCSKFGYLELANVSHMKTEPVASEEESSQSNSKYLELVSHMMQLLKRSDKNPPAPPLITVKE